MKFEQNTGFDELWGGGEGEGREGKKFIGRSLIHARRSAFFTFSGFVSASNIFFHFDPVSARARACNPSPPTPLSTPIGSSLLIYQLRRRRNIGRAVYSFL